MRRLVLNLMCICILKMAITQIPTAFASTKTSVVEVTLTDRGIFPRKIIVPLNQPLTLHIVNEGRRTHEWGVPEYRIYTADIAPHHSSTVSFSPWVQGNFQMISETSEESQAEFTAKFIVDGHSDNNLRK
jgi:Cupredoxin-like domain